MNIKYILLLTALLLSLPGCITDRMPPVSTYRLFPELSSIHKQENLTETDVRTLMLGVIQSSQAFNSTEILYSDARYELNAYAYSRWSDAPTIMLLSTFKRVLNKSKRFNTIVTYASQSQTDLLLESTLIDFSHHINSDSTSNGVLRMSFDLVNKKTLRIIKSREISSTVPATSQDAKGGVAALNIAVINVSRDLIEWLKPGS